MTINGARIKAPKGKSVLDIALEYGICIPHLCHVKTLTPFGACRLCIVELMKNGKSKVTASCTLGAEEGMVVLAHTDKILEMRRNIAEMLVAEAPNSKAIQDMAVRCGVTKVRYPFRDKKCVLCGRCVRGCAELWQSHSLGFVGRGAQRRRMLPFDARPESCKLCFACIDLCPMKLAPCDGYMKKGELRLCGKCESQLTMTLHGNRDQCVDCRLGEGFACGRKPGL